MCLVSGDMADLLAITQNQTTYVVRNACIMTFCVTEARMLDDSLKDTMSYYRTFFFFSKGNRSKGKRAKGHEQRTDTLFDFMVEIYA